MSDAEAVRYESFSWLRADLRRSVAELVSRFVKMCPTCIAKRRNQQPYLSDSLLPPSAMVAPPRPAATRHSSYGNEEQYESSPEIYTYEYPQEGHQEYAAYEGLDGEVSHDVSYAPYPSHDEHSEQEMYYAGDDQHYSNYPFPTYNIPSTSYELPRLASHHISTVDDQASQGAVYSSGEGTSQFVIGDGIDGQDQLMRDIAVWEAAAAAGTFHLEQSLSSNSAASYSIASDVSSTEGAWTFPIPNGTDILPMSQAQWDEFLALNGTLNLSLEDPLFPVSTLEGGSSPEKLEQQPIVVPLPVATEDAPHSLSPSASHHIRRNKPPPLDLTKAQPNAFFLHPTYDCPDDPPFRRAASTSIPSHLTEVDGAAILAPYSAPPHSHIFPFHAHPQPADTSQLPPLSACSSSLSSTSSSGPLTPSFRTLTHLPPTYQTELSSPSSWKQDSNQLAQAIQSLLDSTQPHTSPVATRERERERTRTVSAGGARFSSALSTPLHTPGSVARRGSASATYHRGSASSEALRTPKNDGRFAPY